MKLKKISYLFLAAALYATGAEAQTWKTISAQNFGNASSTPTTAVINSPNSTNSILPGTTDYTVYTGGPSSTLAPSDGQYKVTNYSGRSDNQWVAANDHSTADGRGYMMLINANPGRQGEANGSYYDYALPASATLAGAQYRISYWAGNILVNNSTYKNGYIGVTVRDADNGSGSLYGSGNAILPRTTIATNNVIPWQNQTVNFTLPANFDASKTLYFNFYNTDTDPDRFGNDLVLDDIAIEMLTYSVSGNVFNDLNGDGNIDANETLTATGLYAYVMKSDGTVLYKAAVDNNGNYTLDVPSAPGDIGLKLVISTQNLNIGDKQSATTAQLSGYQAVSENANGAAGITTGAVDAVMNFTNSSHNFTNINFGLKSVPLPVYFGAINAQINGNKLLLNWETLQERGCDHYDIQTSTDGVTFKTIGTINSKAPGGYADAVINYDFTATLPAGMAMGTIPFLLGGVIALLFLNKKNKFIYTFIMAAGMMVFGISCSKKDVPLTEKHTVYVRIVQFDKDGTPQYSKVITAVPQ